MLTPAVINFHNERIDTLIDENEQADATVIFVHGFATDKHETAGYFDDLSQALRDRFRIVRFDFSGCGESEGKTEDINYRKHAEDLDCVINYVKKNFPGEIYILAQSMGCFITSLLNPTDIKKTVFTGLPNSDTQYIAERLKERFGSRPGGKIDYGGISIFPRSTGKKQRIGPLFWKELFSFDPVKNVTKYSKNTHLLIIHPKQDEIIGSECLEQYSNITGIISERIDGDHSFTNKKDREVLTERIKQFFY